MKKKDFEKMAKTDTYLEIENVLVRVACMFFPPLEALCEAGMSFLEAYEKFDPSRNKPFEDYASQHTYYHCLDIRSEEARVRPHRHVLFSELSEETIDFPDEDHVIDIDDESRVWGMISGQTEDVQYVMSFVLSPPSSVKKVIKQYSRPGNEVYNRKLWRQILQRTLTRKKWSHRRIWKTFREAEQAIMSYSPTTLVKG